MSLIDKCVSPRWATSSFGSTASVLPLELDKLAEHMRRCAHDRASKLPFLLARDAIARSIEQRVITTFVMLVAVSLGVRWMLSS